MTVAADPLPARRRVRLKHVASALQGLVLAAVVGALVVGRPGLVSSPVSYVVVSGHSMEPTLRTGDVVVVARAASYRRGDVVAYRVPAGEPGAGLVVIHRIVGGGARDGYVMRGDNKHANDPWRPRPDGVVGRLRVTVPKLGLTIGYVHTPLGLGAIAALVAFGIAFGPKPKPKPESRAD